MPRAVHRDSAFGSHVTQTWSGVVIASWIVVAVGATGARLAPFVGAVAFLAKSASTSSARAVGYSISNKNSVHPEPFDIAQDTPVEGCVSHLSTGPVRRVETVQDARAAGADEALPARHRKLIRKRFRRRFGGLASSVALRNELLVAGFIGARQVANLDLPVPSRDHARAPPPSNHPA
jgi:hypothetical protein